MSDAGAPLRLSLATVRGRLRRGAIRDALPEVAIALLIAAALGVGPLSGARGWMAAAALLFAIASAWVLARRRALRVTPFLCAYVVVYVLAALHGSSPHPEDVARYIVRPLVAVAVALVIVGPRQRLRVLLIMGVFVVFEVAVTAIQAAENVVKHGRDTANSADSVTGTLGTGQAGTVTLVAMIVALIATGAWAAGALRASRAIALIVACGAVGVFTSTRAVVGYAPVSGLCVALTAAVACRRTRKVLTVAVGAVVAAPILYLGTLALYPSAFTGALSSQQTTVLGGAAAQGITTNAVVRPHQPPSAPPHGEPPVKPPAAKGQPPAPKAPSGVELLPGRFSQIRVARELVTHGGLANDLLGYGLGSARQDPRYQLAQDVPLPQRTGSTWIGRVLTEAGWLGLGAFVALLAWLVLLGRSLSRHATPQTTDQALGLALPAVAVLTGMGAVFTTVLDVRGYSFLFWIVVGLAISAYREHPKNAPNRASVCHE